MWQSAPSRWQQVCGSLERVAGIVNDAIEALDLTGVTLVGSDTAGDICQLAVDARGRPRCPLCPPSSEFQAGPQPIRSKVGTATTSSL
jgi:hypothetical protein